MKIEFPQPFLQRQRYRHGTLDPVIFHEREPDHAHSRKRPRSVQSIYKVLASTFQEIVDFFSIENKTPGQPTNLHCVHEGALDFFEHHDSKEK